MVMDVTKNLPGHTPFCKQTCSVKHCELIMCLVNCPDNKRMIKGLASLKQSLFQSLQEGWNPHANVVDPLLEFQSPLVHWASVLGKDFALEWLIKMNFRTNAISDRTGETAVHRMLKCLYGVKQLDGMSAREIFNLFSSLLSLLTGSCSDLLSIQDNEGNTAFHTCAMLIISQEGTTSELEYFENCMVAMLRSLTNDKTSSTNNTESFKVLNFKNTNSETILHILASRNTSFNIMRYVMRRFNHVIDKNSLNNEGKSALDIAIKSEMYSVAKELGSTDKQGDSYSISRISVEEHIGEWDPSFGKSKTQTPKQKTRTKRSRTLPLRSERSTARYETFEHDSASFLDRGSEVEETVDVDSSSSSSSCVYVVNTNSPGALESQRVNSPGLTRTANEAASDKNDMDVDIAGMISINLPNVIAVDTGDLSVKDVTTATSSADSQSSKFDCDQHSFSYNPEQGYDTQQQCTSENGHGECSSICGCGTQEESGACCNQTPTHSSTQSQHISSCANEVQNCSPLIKLIKEESDVATLIQARLTDKRQKLETYLSDYTNKVREMEKRGSQCCLLLSEYKDERDTIVLEEQLKDQEKRKLLQRIEELEKSRTEPRKRLKFLEGKIAELEKLSEQSLKTIEIRNDHCSEVKRKITEYDEALNEIASGRLGSKKIKVEPLDN